MWLWFIRKKRECLKWFLERQLKSPKNSSFAGFYKQPLVENTQQSLHVRVVDSLLSLCSYLYLFGLKVHRGWYQSGLVKSSQLYVKEPNGSKRQIFTFAVGNYTWGGTGKTPFVMFLSKLLVSRGYQPVILSRGYGHKDEAKMMIRQGLAIEVLTGSNREEAFQKVFSSVVSSSTMVVILDDGLQHWRLKRQVNVLMVNAALAFGVNGYFIPRGSLREPPCEAASRSTCIVLHHCNQVSDFQLQQLKAWFQMQCPEKPILTSFMISLQTRMLSYVVE
ncbi:tetraacyldisaccharide 4'-kinase isoform 2 [Galdieria sulphuraria]|uniref:tetraacyldisaccharide 4'-kinase n=1 Tax=Galdieria sulphuraria TaxID=130081 RepID=M2XWK7_GALSU|nr:tetraacyldisaccharide 4'-kinase isoform 2 [Galdieria sulphuraria]EME28003.1 tetraacyldisaccharide 4'-kinase isoform 2 [Galdieria sulphuraria]|eukprot:XP_005704523.1 tetraacyldisaccharide 4'-kinase isoform 2 [Galdieria sulphuraria]